MIPHRARFLRGRRSLLEAHRRDELEIFPVRRPIPVFRLRIVLESADRELPISLADRRGRIAAIPDHLRRDTLSDRAFRRGLDEDSDIAVRVNVDESGGDIRPRRVDRPVAFRTPEGAHSYDLPSTDSDVGDAPGGARPIEHTPTADDDVERHLMENARGAFNIVHRDHPGEQSWRRKSTLFKVNICGAAIFVQMASSFIAASENVASVARNRL